MTLLSADSTADLKFEHAVDKVASSVVVVAAEKGAGPAGVGRVAAAIDA